MYGIGLFGGGFLQNELILEFPTKSMPSGFRTARGPWIIGIETNQLPTPIPPDPPPLAGEGREGGAVLT